MEIKREDTNESKVLPFRTGDQGSWIAEWPFHQGCKERYCFAGFLKDETESDQEYFIQYRIINRKAFGHKQILKMSITDLESGHCYSCEKEEFISMDEVGKVRTKSSMVSPDLDNQRWFLYARTKQFSFRFHMKSAKVPNESADSDKILRGIGVINNGENRTFSFSDLPTRGTLFFHRDDGSTKMVRCKGYMWFEKEYGSS